jgi:primase-polymerase (primpol)-like protein
MPQAPSVDNGEGRRYSDVQVIERALRNNRTGELFGRLLKGDQTLWTGEDARYPSHSEAVWAFLQQLKFWTYGDAEQTERIFRTSGLYDAKWDEKRGPITFGAAELRKVFGETPAVRK